MKEMTGTIDISTEAKAVTDYIAQKWSPFEGLGDFVLEVADKAAESGKTWFAQHPIWELAVGLCDKRIQHLGSKSSGDHYYDAVWALLNHISMRLPWVRDVAVFGVSHLRRWDFSSKADGTYYALREKYPDLDKSKPLGWDELAKGYSEFDGQEEYRAGPDRELFQGHDTASHSASDFVVRTALPYVMYDKVGQGRCPGRVLSGAIYGHFLSIIEQNNTRALLAELAEVAATLPTEHVYDLKVEFKHPMLRVICAEMREFFTKEEHEAAKVAKAEYEALSDDEKKARSAKAREEVAESVKAMLRDNDKFEEDRKMRNERIQALLEQEFA